MQYSNQNYTGSGVRGAQFAGNPLTTGSNVRPVATVQNVGSVVQPVTYVQPSTYVQPAAINYQQQPQVTSYAQPASIQQNYQTLQQVSSKAQF